MQQSYNIPDLKLVEREADGTGWSIDVSRSDQSFCEFDPTVLRDIVYATFDLDSETQESSPAIHFIAAYTHRLAYGFAEARTPRGKPAFDVECSDSSQAWVDRGKELGLSSTRVHAGAIDLKPDTLCVSSFQPYPIYRTLSGYLAVLKSLAHTRGYLELSGEFSEMGEISSDGEPLRSDFRIAKLFYGAQAEEIKTSEWSIVQIFTTPEAKEKATRDLAVIDWVNQHPNGSLAELVEAIEDGRDMVIRSLERVDVSSSPEPWRHYVPFDQCMQFPRIEVQ